MRTLADLTRINSINPSLVPGAPGEAKAAAYVKEALGRLGLDVARVEAAPGRPSVIGILHGRGGGRSLMLNGHLDTVGLEGMPDVRARHLRDGGQPGGLPRRRDGGGGWEALAPRGSRGRRRGG